MNRPNRHPWLGPEWATVLAIAVLGAGLRLTAFGRQGLDHFDEGIYASAGAWSLGRDGLSGIDPGLIPYAPPGYPTLVGLAYVLFGPSDLAAIAVSVLAGVATIPMVAWLGRRAFGSTFGAAAAGFAALSMAHITFSRMALTDALFLLAWCLGMALGGRFLERPGPGRAVALGLAVGAAQMVKYNGWLLGAIVAATALLGPSWRDRLRTFGWGLLAAGVAGLVYWPWFRFVAAHGGYASLLAHQRGYMAGVSAWPAHWLTQLRQVVALEGGPPRAAAGVVTAIVGVVGTALIARRERPRARSARDAVLDLALLALMFVLLAQAASGWWLGLALAGFSLRDEAPAVRLLGAWWLTLAILTPFYHPYARLWLPLTAVGWLMSGRVVGVVLGRMSRPDRDDFLAHRGLVGLTLASLVAACVVPVLVRPRPVPLPSPFGPRDSFRVASARIIARVPDEARAVGMLARPTLPFYAAGPLATRGVSSFRVESLAALGESGLDWLILDSALLRQEVDTHPLDRWEVVASEPTTLSNATMLDVDPASAVGDRSARDAPLLLLRPRREGRSR